MITIQRVEGAGVHRWAYIEEVMAKSTRSTWRPSAIPSIALNLCVRYIGPRIHIHWTMYKNI